MKAEISKVLIALLFTFNNVSMAILYKIQNSETPNNSIFNMLTFWLIYLQYSSSEFPIILRFILLKYLEDTEKSILLHYMTIAQNCRMQPAYNLSCVLDLHSTTH